MPFNLTITPAQRKRWQDAATRLSVRLGVNVTLSAFLRKAADELAERERVIAETTKIRRRTPLR